jgi:putative DNA primase/helicase
MVIHAADEILACEPDNIPSELKALHRWCCWNAVPKKSKPDEMDKKPVRADNPRIGLSKTSPEQWRDFTTAERCLAGGEVSGLGFLTGGGIVAIDIDEVVGPDGELPAEVSELLTRLATYCELSPSGRGVRAFLLGTLPGKNITSKAAGLELYGEGGYVTVTGHRLEAFPGTVAEGGELLAELYAKASARPAKPAPEKQRPRPASAPLGADEVVQLARRSRHATAVEALLAGDWQGAYPTQSEAELALANHLAFYAGPGGEAVVLEAIRSSGMAREKNGEPRGASTHLGLTVSKAFEGRTDFYAAGRNGKATATVAALPVDRPLTGPACLTVPSTLTDIGLGRRLVARAAGTLRWCTQHKQWMAWDGQRWVPDDGARAAAAAKRVADELWREMADAGPAAATKEVVRFVRAASDARTIGAAVLMARSEPGIAVSTDELDTHHWLFNCANGTLDLRTLKLLPHTPGHLLTHFADAVAFEPTAEAPTWKRFLVDVTGGDELLERFLQRSFGICLTGDVSEQHLWLHHGTGRNGKSTTLELLSYLMGSYAGPAPSELLLATDRGPEVERQVASLAGRRLVTTREVAQGRRLNEVAVKSLTGGDTIQGRHIYGSPFTLCPTWKLHVACNHRPVVHGTDNGIWRRLLLVPWNERFEGARDDKRLGEKLRAELPGILNWMVAGLVRWQAEGLAPPERVTVATAGYAGENDVIGRWLEERTLTGRQYVAEAGALYRNYTAWCEERGERVMSLTALGLELERRGFTSERHTSGPHRFKTVRLGLGLVSERAE